MTHLCWWAGRTLLWFPAGEHEQLGCVRGPFCRSQASRLDFPEPDRSQASHDFAGLESPPAILHALAKRFVLMSRLLHDQDAPLGADDPMQLQERLSRFRYVMQDQYRDGEIDGCVGDREFR
jgi:hypothetical protein